MDLLFSMIFGSGFAVVIAIAGIAIFLNFVPLGLWISAIAAGVNVGIFNLIGMRLRRVPASQMLTSWRRIIWQAVTLTALSTL